MEKVRAVSLIRASTKQQTDKNNDIPTQRQIVSEFIENNKWKLIKEFVEGGISGFKESANERDALIKIKEMALKNEFDILVVYMSDRLGRIADETPLVIKYLNEHNVKVWSVSEGEIKSDTHADKLITYIRYWQNEGESLKTSKRVTDYQIASIERGCFRGGSFIPFGYKLVDNGSRNFKGRHILDLVINQDEAEIVKLIYHLSLNKNYGQSRIAKYLNQNGYKNRNKKGWHSTTIQYILANPIYKGQLHIHSKLYNKTVTSAIREDLVIIPEDVWDKNRRAVEARTYKKNTDVICDTRVKNTHGKMLLSGFVFCGYCGCALTTMSDSTKLKLDDGTYGRKTYHKYRCSSFYKKGAIECEGQSTYANSKIDPVVIQETKRFITSLQEKDGKELYLEKVNEALNHYESLLKLNEKELRQIAEEAEVLKKEIAKAIIGRSAFSVDDLKEAIEINENQEKEKQKENNKINTKLVEFMEKKESIISLDSQLLDWESKFDNMDFDGKKAMLATVIDKVIVYRDNIEIVFNIRFETYKNSLGCNSTQLVRVPR